METSIPPPSANFPEKKQDPVLFVLMGASNLARAYNALVRCLARSLEPRPVEFLQAMGPGRGYCTEGGLLTIRYPPIVSCGILEAAKSRARSCRRVIALITDIGNDIMYNISAREIIESLEKIITDLHSINAVIFVNPIPIDMSKDVTLTQFKLIRFLFYPKSPVQFDQAAEAVKTINRYLRDQAEAGRVRLLPDLKPFCGGDKIHYSLKTSHKAWTLVAEELLKEAGTVPRQSISWFSTFISLLANLGRLYFCDMFCIRKKIPGSY